MIADDNARPNRAFSVRDALEQDIVTGKFLPGERLDELTLARRFEVSRTPIREALLQLGASGLVEQHPHRGTFVVERTPAAIVEMFEVMAELEGMCGRLAARRATREHLRALVAAHEACQAVEADETDAYYYANEMFHRAIYVASGNAFLNEQAGMLHTRLKPYRRLQLRVPGRVRRSLLEHTQIVEAIKAGDGATAEAVLKSHIVIQGENFSDFFAALSAEQNRLAHGVGGAPRQPAARPVRKKVSGDVA
jgi:DNA-binding GntR family transcriptional regulator